MGMLQLASQDRTRPDRLLQVELKEPLHDWVAARIEAMPPSHQRLLRVAMVPGQGNRGWQARLFRVSERSLGKWRASITRSLQVHTWEQSVALAFVSGCVEAELIVVPTMGT